MKAGDKMNYNHRPERLCEGMSFTAAEEYKMLRTKIDLVLPNSLKSDSDGDNHRRCRAIGITSALRGEGKTTTAINLSYTFAEAGCGVCLVEADMRLPSIGAKLGIEGTPGLSNILSGGVGVEDSLKQYNIYGGTTFDMIPAGDIPPLPSEMLASENMKALLESLGTRYDYIIVDLPPINAVTDALALAKSNVLDGMLFVVREKVGTRSALSHALEQFSLTDTKLLGIVYNGNRGHAPSSRYYRRR